MLSPLKVWHGNICEMFQTKGLPKSQNFPQHWERSRFYPLPRTASSIWSVALGRNPGVLNPPSCYNVSIFARQKNRKFGHRNCSRYTDYKGEISHGAGQLSQYPQHSMIRSESPSSCFGRGALETRWWGCPAEKIRYGGWPRRGGARCRFWEFPWLSIVVSVTVIIYTVILNFSIIPMMSPDGVWWNIKKWFVYIQYPCMWSFLFLTCLNIRANHEEHRRKPTVDLSRKSGGRVP